MVPSNGSNGVRVRGELAGMSCANESMKRQSSLLLKGAVDALLQCGQRAGLVLVVAEISEKSMVSSGLVDVVEGDSDWRQATRGTV